MKKTILASLVGFFAITPAMAQDRAPIVLELFTSQSCSSCPPADRVLGEFAKRENIIALSCHVTYWNHLHWKDTLSKEFCTKRQRQYVQALDSRGPYTPQIVINGHHELIGSQARKISKILDREKGAVKPIYIHRNKDQFDITLPKLPRSEYIVTLISYGDNHVQDIPSGENRGRTVLYTNPVKSIKNLGAWDGSEKLISHEYFDPNIVVLVQEEHVAGKIIAAGKIQN